jgi:hypothetical protein
VSDPDLRALQRLLDTMDDHFDQKISDREFLQLASAARDSLSPAAARDPALAAAVRALHALLSAASPPPAEPYGNLRIALAGPEKFRKRRHPSNTCQGIIDSEH